jgi:hypothetical protein
VGGVGVGHDASEVRIPLGIAAAVALAAGLSAPAHAAPTAVERQSATSLNFASPASATSLNIALPGEDLALNFARKAG